MSQNPGALKLSNDTYAARLRTAGRDGDFSAAREWWAVYHRDEHNAVAEVELVWQAGVQSGGAWAVAARTKKPSMRDRVIAECVADLRNASDPRFRRDSILVPRPRGARDRWRRPAVDFSRRG